MNDQNMKVSNHSWIWSSIMKQKPTPNISRCRTLHYWVLVFHRSDKYIKEGLQSAYWIQHLRLVSDLNTKLYEKEKNQAAFDSNSYTRWATINKEDCSPHHYQQMQEPVVGCSEGYSLPFSLSSFRVGAWSSPSSWPCSCWGFQAAPLEGKHSPANCTKIQWRFMLVPSLWNQQL